MSDEEPRYAKIGDKIVSTVNHPPGSWVERKYELSAILRNQASVDYANTELIPSGRWKVTNDNAN